MKVFFNSLFPAVMHKSVAIQNGNIANNRKSVWHTEGKDRKRQRGAGEKKLDEKLNISIYSIFIITH